MPIVSMIARRKPLLTCKREGFIYTLELKGTVSQNLHSLVFSVNRTQLGSSVTAWKYFRFGNDFMKFFDLFESSLSVLDTAELSSLLS